MAKSKTVKDASIVEEKDAVKFEDVDVEEKEEAVEEVKKETEPKKEEKEKAKKEKKEKVKKEKKDGFFSGTRKEMKKVVWPKFVEVMKYTLAVIIFCLFLSLLFWAVTSIVALVKRLVG